jgi:hypothetical protein
MFSQEDQKIRKAEFFGGGSCQKNSPDLASSESNNLCLPDLSIFLLIFREAE